MSKKKQLSPIEKFMALSEAEKVAQVAPFESEPRAGVLKGKPLTPAQRKLWNGVRGKMGRPKVGQGSKMIPVSIERGLLKEADAYAKAHKMKRSQLIAEGLRMRLRRTGS